MDKVILCYIDKDQNGGAEIAKLYSVRNYPTFILVNSSKETIDRWTGFSCQECFVKRLQTVLEDQVTVHERKKRFTVKPTEMDAWKLGEFHHNKGLFAEAIAYYRRAKELNPLSDVNYDMHIFGAMAYGNFFQLFSVDQVKAQADILLNSGQLEDKKLLKVAYSMMKMAKRAKDFSIALPYLKIAVEELANSKDEHVLKKRATLLPEYTLHILKDTPLAVKQKKDVQKDNWLNDADLLNNYAWWCFENQINLHEAEKMARKALKLAKPGIQKANILDTLAEIRYSLGDTDEALKYIKMAVSEQPDKDYFQKQLKRFKKAAASR